MAQYVQSTALHPAHGERLDGENGDDVEVEEDDECDEVSRETEASVEVVGGELWVLTLTPVRPVQLGPVDRLLQLVEVHRVVGQDESLLSQLSADSEGRLLCPPVEENIEETEARDEVSDHGQQSLGGGTESPEEDQDCGSEGQVDLLVLDTLGVEEHTLH